jgi:hypothetical protein
VKFNLPQPAPMPAVDTTLKVGNVYRCKGGGKTHYWVIVGLSDRSVNLIGINSQGQITSTANYGQHVFDSSSSFYPGRELLGRCSGLEELEFDIEWISGGDRP